MKRHHHSPRSNFKTTALCLATVLAVPTAPVGADNPSDPASGRVRECLNGIWQIGPLIDRDWHAPANLADTTTLKWEDTRVPGTWRGGDWHHEQEFDVDAGRMSKVDEVWYRRSFEVPTTWRGARIQIDFGAVGYYAEVYVNRHPVGHHVGGFTPFTVTVDPHVIFGETNELLVFVKGFRRGWGVPPEACLIASGNRFAGIWQDVFLARRPKLRVEDVCITTSVRRGEISADVAITNDGKYDVSNLSVTCAVVRNDVVIQQLPIKRLSISGDSSISVTVRKNWADAIHWSPENPHLYTFVTELHDGKLLIDRTATRFGFREFWIEGQDFMLNGRVTRLRAFLYDHGVPLSMYRKDFLRGYFTALKEEVNYNAVRFFNIVPKSCLEVTDELGILVAEGSAVTSMEISNRFDRKTSHARIQSEFAEWIRSHRNHPSVVIWEAQNENWTVGFGLVKSERPWSRDHFGWLPAFGLTMEGVQRKVGRYHDWLLSLEEWIRRHDLTRVITHSGAMMELGFDTTSHREPDLHEHRYLAGDLGGAMAHYDFHYPYEKHARREMVHFMRHWAQNKSKPMIVGEFLAEETYPQEGWGIRRIGEHALADGYTAENAAAGADVAMLLKGWRTAGVSAMFLFYPNYYVFKNVLPSDFVFRWDDLNVPGAHPVRPSARFFNPGWAPDLPSHVPNLNSGMYQALQESLNPLLITFGERWHRHALSGEVLERTVYLVNDTQSEQQVRWVGTIEGTNGRIAHRDQPVVLAPGQIFSEQWQSKLPHCDVVQRYRLSLRLQRGDTTVSNETHTVTVFPHRHMEPPALPDGSIALHDPAGAVAPIFNTMHLPYTPLSDASTLDPGTVRMCIIGPDAADMLEDPTQRSALTAYVSTGGRLLVLNQGTVLLDGLEAAKPITESDFAEYTHAQIASRSHAVFAGIDPKDLHDWNGNHGIMATYPLSRCVRNGRALLFSGWKHALLAEGVRGRGRFILSQLHLTNRYGKDPVATRLFHNLVRYLMATPLPKTLETAYIGPNCLLANRYGLDILDAALDPTPALTAKDILIVGRGMWSDRSPLAKHVDGIMRFAEEGGTVLMLPQTPGEFLSLALPGHPTLRVFETDFIFKTASTSPFLWGISGFDLSRSRPHRGLTAGGWGRPKIQSEIVDLPPPWESLLLASTRYGNDDIYADADVGGVFPSGGSALAQISHGRGRIILCQLDFDRRATVDPASLPAPHRAVMRDPALNVADTLFFNLGVRPANTSP